MNAKTTAENPKDSIGKRKVPLSYLCGPSLAHEALAMKDGANKYGRGNFREAPVKATIYIDAALRHIFDWLDGEEFAPDSGVHHLGHAKATLAIILDAMHKGTLIDDRPEPGTSAGVFKSLEQNILIPYEIADHQGEWGDPDVETPAPPAAKGEWVINESGRYIWKNRTIPGFYTEPTRSYSIYCGQCGSTIAGGDRLFRRLYGTSMVCERCAEAIADEDAKRQVRMAEDPNHLPDAQSSVAGAIEDSQATDENPDGFACWKCSNQIDASRDAVTKINGMWYHARCTLSLCK